MTPISPSQHSQPARYSMKFWLNNFAQPYVHSGLSPTGLFSHGRARICRRTGRQTGCRRTLLPCLTGLLLLLWQSCALSTQPAARLGISPDRYMIDLEEGGSAPQALMIKNLSDEPLTVKLSVSNWDLDASNRVRILPPREGSLDQWIVINPLRVVIPPGMPQTIRWAVMPRQRPATGEHRAIIFIEEETGPRQRSNNTSVQMAIRFGIPVYAQFGEVHEQVDVIDISPSVDGTQIIAEALNQGNRHARLQGRFGVWPADAFPGPDQAIDILRDPTLSRKRTSEYETGDVAETVLLPATRREIKLLPDQVLTPGQIVQFDAHIGSTAVVRTVRVAGS